MQGSAPCAVCSSRTEARCISWCMRLTDAPASICCRNSSDGSAPMPTIWRCTISSQRSRPCHPGHPLENLLREVPDLREEAALADALLHPLDRAYSVPQLFDLIAKAGLAFGRWLKQAPYTAHCGVVATIPQASRLAQLSSAEQYAAIELFRGTMVRHSVIAYRDDSPGGAQPIRFDGDAWLGYVPLRMPDTLCVQERLPQGAAAVLINPTHAYRDLIVPIDSTEKGWFDAIDGNRSIGDIVEGTLPSPSTKSHLDMARPFFQKLWWYDQVVFDASRCRA